MKIKDKILSETSEEVKQRVRDTANKLVMKQETLEEATERLKGKELFKESNDRARKILSEIKSLPIQERSYSEEDIKLAFIEGHNICRCVTDNTDEAKECFNEWFEQFKKK